MQHRSRLPRLGGALLLGALALPLAACQDTGSEPLAPGESAPAARAAVTDAELAAAQLREVGPGARIW